MHDTVLSHENLKANFNYSEQHVFRRVPHLRPRCKPHFLITIYKQMNKCFQKVHELLDECSKII